MLRFAVVVACLSGCELYFSEPKSDPGGGVDAAPEPDPFTIARPCIRDIVGGNLLLADNDEFFLNYACGGGAIVMWLVERGGVLEVLHENGNYQDQFRSLRVARTEHGESVIGMFEHAPQIWLFQNASAQRTEWERSWIDLHITDVDGDDVRDYLIVGDNEIRRASAFSSRYWYPLVVPASDEVTLLKDKPYVTAVRAQLGGDALPDLFYATADGELGIAIQTAPDTFMVTSTTMDAGTPQRLLAGDVDGDGIDDVVGAAGHLFVRGSKTGTLALLPDAVQAFTLGDLDGDGRREVVYITADKQTVRRVDVQPDGSLTTSLVYAGGGDGLAVANLDGDSRGDLALLRDRGKQSSTVVIKHGASIGVE